LKKTPVPGRTVGQMVVAALLQLGYWVRERSIVMSMSVCLSVFSLSTSFSQEPHVQILPNYLHMLPVTMAQSSSGGVLPQISYARTSGFVDDEVMFADNRR